MQLKKQIIDDLDLRGKRVIIRADFNVPLNFYVADFGTIEALPDPFSGSIAFDAGTGAYDLTIPDREVQMQIGQFVLYVLNALTNFASSGQYPTLHDALSALINCPGLQASIESLIGSPQPWIAGVCQSVVDTAVGELLTAVNSVTVDWEVMQFDQHEYPMSMDTVLRSAGITTVDWDCKTACCGAAFSLTETGIVHKLSAEILDEAVAVGANALAVACPLCHSNLDARQGEIEDISDVSYGLPVFYFTQLLGLAMGVPAGKLGIARHLVDAQPLLRSAAMTAKEGSRPAAG